MKKVLLLLSLLPSMINSQTNIPGGYVSGIWTASQSPYNIQGSVMIPNDSLLTIEPGVTVNFLGHYKLIVMGRLMAVGLLSDSIRFTATDTTTGWYGIRFDNTLSANDSSMISYCSLQWGNANGSGNDGSGGSIMCYNFSKVHISNNFFQNNYATIPFGGGIFLNNSSCIIHDNILSKGNGGIYVSGGSHPLIYNNNISFNIGVGVMITNAGSNCNVHDNLITWNTGTGLQCQSSSVEISHNIVSYNNIGTNSYPGGIWCNGGMSILSKNTVTNNSGTGIFIMNSNGIVSDNIIANNSANGFYGECGGILCSNGSPLLINNTIVNNQAQVGAGMLFSSSNATVYNCIVYGNVASTDGSQIYLKDESSDPHFYNCDIQSGLPGFGLNGTFYTGTYSYNIDADPGFVSISAGAGNGFNGTTADWSLQSSSACIDAGNSSVAATGTDISGNPRIAGAFIDLGAFEFPVITGMDNHSMTLSSFVFPNPFSTTATIKISGILNNRDELILSDLSGREQRRILISSNQIDINRENLDVGIYIFRIYQNGSLLNSGKIVVQN